MESSDDTNAVDDFAQKQEQPNLWVAVNSVSPGHGSTHTIITNLTPGRYYVRITGGTALSGGILLGATI